MLIPFHKQIEMEGSKICYFHHKVCILYPYLFKEWSVCFIHVDKDNCVDNPNHHDDNGELIVIGGEGAILMRYR